MTYATMKPSGDLADIPDYPPRRWFTEAPRPGVGWHIDDNGRVRGRLFDHDLPSTLVHRGGLYAPEPSSTGWAGFHVGTARVADGADVAVGTVTLGHPDGTGNPTRAVAVVRAGTDEHGVWIGGALLPRRGSVDPLTFDGDRIRVADIIRWNAMGISGSWKGMSREWWERHGHTAAAAQSETELVSIALVTGRGLPLAGKARGRQRLTQIAGMVAADDARTAAVADVLRCSQTLARAQERARLATLAVVRPDPNAWRSRVRLAAISLRAGQPFRPGPEGLTERLGLLLAQKRVRIEQARLGRALDKLQEADTSSSLELIDALPAELPRPVARLRVYR